MRPCFVLVIAAAVVGCGATASQPLARVPAPGSDLLPVITPDELSHDLYAFADDSMRGRETGTPDATRAAVFIAERLKALGVSPAGDSSYFQRVPLQRDELGPKTRFSVTGSKAVTQLALGTDFVPLTGALGPGAAPRLDASGAIVFAGYGIESDKPDRHDLRGLDAAGKIIVIVHGAPPGSDSLTRATYEDEGYLSTRISAAITLHPAGIVVLFSGATRKMFDEAAPQLLRAVTIRTGAPDPPPESRQLPMILMGLARAGSPLLPKGWPADDHAQPLPGEFTGHIEMLHAPFTAYNVVGLVPGADPAMNRTYVAYGAHLDHIGVQHGMVPDSIANGADDDGSGTVALMAIAGAMRVRHPKRSVLFVWHVGEEKGMLGSLWFTDHPMVPIDSIVVQLNADMIGRNAPNELYVVGPGAAPNNQSKVIGTIVDSVNAAEAQPFTFNRGFDRVDDPQRAYYRSDHFNYARKGIPIVFFTTGLHDDYHTVSDSPDRIAYVKLARVAGLMLDVGVATANRPTRPR